MVQESRGKNRSSRTLVLVLSSPSTRNTCIISQATSNLPLANLCQLTIFQSVVDSLKICSFACAQHSDKQGQAGNPKTNREIKEPGGAATGNSFFSARVPHPPLCRRYRARPLRLGPAPRPLQTISRTPPLIARVQHPPLADEKAHAPFDCKGPAPPICTRYSTPQHPCRRYRALQTISRTPLLIVKPSTPPLQTISRTPPLIARAQHPPLAYDIAHAPFDCKGQAPPLQTNANNIALAPFDCKGPAPLPCR